MFSCSPAKRQYLGYSSCCTISFSTSAMLSLHQAVSFIRKKRRWFQCFIAKFKATTLNSEWTFSTQTPNVSSPTINILSNPYCVQWVAINFWSIMLVVCPAFLTQKSCLFSSNWSRIACCLQLMCKIIISWLSLQPCTKTTMWSLKFG